jgi:hypothetical protein
MVEVSNVRDSTVQKNLSTLDTPDVARLAASFCCCFPSFSDLMIKIEVIENRLLHPSILLFCHGPNPVPPYILLQLSHSIFLQRKYRQSFHFDNFLLIRNLFLKFSHFLNHIVTMRTSL